MEVAVNHPPTHRLPLAAGLIAALTLALPAWAGELEPSGPPAPTMKSLDDIPGSWSRILPADDTGDPCNSSRFKCVLSGNKAVLDRETGLVWERSPVSATSNWYEAVNLCAFLNNGTGRLGWRLPSYQELNSLVDLSAPSAPILPPGHPFQNVAVAGYWSATDNISTSSTTGDQARYVNFFLGAVFPTSKNADLHRWCVRGGSGRAMN
jgi:hypothetical protein